MMDIAMVILAAGLSERMGVFKPLLPVGGQAAVLRCIRTAEAAGIRDICVVTGHMREGVESVLRDNAPQVAVVHNSGYRDGMFSSVRAGVAALVRDADGIFLLPADCCAVSPETLRILIREFYEKKGAFVTRSRFNGRRGHPPLIPARFIDSLLEYDGHNGLKGFLSPLPTYEVEMDSPDSLMDMDTPSDYAELLGFLGLPVYPGREMCAELLMRFQVPQDIVEHGKHVAALALEMARLMELGGGAVDAALPMSGYTALPMSGNGKIDAALLESACLLHDICRSLPDHARAGRDLLLREGYPGTAMLVGSHMDLHYYDTGIGEAELLFLADKLSRRGKLTPLEGTMLEMESRYAHDPDALEAARRRVGAAMAIMGELSDKYGITYGDLEM